MIKKQELKCNLHVTIINFNPLPSWLLVFSLCLALVWGLQRNVLFSPGLLWPPGWCPLSDICISRYQHSANTEPRGQAVTNTKTNTTQTQQQAFLTRCGELQMLMYKVWFIILWSRLRPLKCLPRPSLDPEPVSSMPTGRDRQLSLDWYVKFIDRAWAEHLPPCGCLPVKRRLLSPGCNYNDYSQSNPSMRLPPGKQC